MAAHGWRPEHPLEELLFAEGHRFDFYQAVKLLEILRPKSVSVGSGSEPHQEAVRFRSTTSLAFPASEIHEITDPKDPLMVVNFLGLAGVTGPLPLPFTEYIQQRLWEKDTALRDFLDIFNHRLVSMVYRIRRKHRVGLETASPEHHGFASLLYALIGLETAGLRGRMKVPDRALLRYAGLLSKHPRSASGLCAMLGDFFGVPVRDRQFRGAFRSFDKDQWTAIGVTGRNNRLGQDVMLGTQIWDQQAGIDLCVGPLRWSQYLDMLPGEGGFVSLCQLTRFYLGENLDFGVRLSMKAEEIHPARISVKNGPRLGWTSWLSHGVPLQGDVEIQVADVPAFRDTPAPAYALNPLHEPVP